MSEKTSAEVIIGGKVYTLSGYEGEEYLQKVAAYINNKINEFDAMEAFRRFPADMKSTLIELNIADDYFKAKAQIEKLENEIAAKEKEVYDLKHDLISNQIKAESDEKTIKELEAENRELLLNKAKLEASLEDALLGKVTTMKKKEITGSEEGVREEENVKTEEQIKTKENEDAQESVKPVESTKPKEQHGLKGNEKKKTH